MFNFPFCFIPKGARSQAEGGKKDMQTPAIVT